MTETSDSLISIGPASWEDLAQIQRVHEKAFVGFFLTRMGGRFVRAYYATILAYPHGRLFVAREGQRILGFAGAVIDPEAYYNFMASRRRNLILPTLVGVMRRPSLLPRVIFNRSRVVNYYSSSDVESALLCELVSIGISPDAGKRGIGKMLMEAVRGFGVGEKVREIFLTTDAHENEYVNRFYVKLGYELSDTFESGGGRIMHGYRLQICPRQ